MEFTPLEKNGPWVLTPKLIGDKRGYFMETFRQNEFAEHCGDYDFKQDNQSSSRGGVLRGLHYQLRRPQGKLARVIRGRVFDVAVDLRRSSPHFGKWYGVELDDVARRIFWIPPGFAHGFFVLSEDAEFLYKCTDYYAPEEERCVIWNDPDIGVAWPLTASPILSDKDRLGSPLAGAETYA